VSEARYGGELKKREFTHVRCLGVPALVSTRQWRQILSAGQSAGVYGPALKLKKNLSNRAVHPGWRLLDGAISMNIHHPLTNEFVRERPDPKLIGESVQIVYPGSAHGINHWELKQFTILLGMAMGHNDFGYDTSHDLNCCAAASSSSVDVKMWETSPQRALRTRPAAASGSISARRDPSLWPRLKASTIPVLQPLWSRSTTARISGSRGARATNSG
jgi:hypothetical protein